MSGFRRAAHICVCIVVLGVHLVLLVLAILVVCVAICVCIVVRGVHLVLLMLDALCMCVGYMYVLWCLAICVYCGARSAPGAVYVLAICMMGCLACTWCKKRVAFVKFQTFPISYGVHFVGHVCIEPQQS